MFVRDGIEVVAFCAIGLVLSSCDSSQSNAPGGTHDRLHADSVGGVLNVEASPYNASPGTDAYPAIQAALNDACQTSSYYVPPVYIPEGTFLLSQPLDIVCTNEIVGASRHGTILQPTFHGPAILVGSPMPSLTTGPALVGTGNSIVEPVGPYNLGLVNLRDVPTAELDGLGAFTAEAFVNVTSYISGSFASIVTSQGHLGVSGPGLGLQFGFALGLSSDLLSGVLTVGGNTLAVNSSTTVSLNTTHHVALSYDGTTIRLFLDGTVVASAAASGPIKQLPFEDINIASTGEGLEGQPYEGPFVGSLDSVRLSSVARYTGSFPVPTDKLPTDASTLALLNFEPGQPPGVVKVWGGNTPYWVPIRVSENSVRVALHNFTIDADMGVVATNLWTSDIYQMDFLNCDYGIETWGAAANVYADLAISPGSSRGRYGILGVSIYGGDEYRDLVLGGQTYPLIAEFGQGGGPSTFNNIAITPGDRTIFGALIDRDDATINGMTIAAGGDAYQAGLVLLGTDPHPVIANASIVGEAGKVRRGGPPAAQTVAGRSVPPILVDTWGSSAPNEMSAIVESSSFVATQGDANLIALNYTPAAGATGTVTSDLRSDSQAALSNDPNAAAMASSGHLVDPTAIPPMDPGSTPITQGVVGPGVYDVSAYGAVPSTNTSVSSIDNTVFLQQAIDDACAHGGGTVLLSEGEYGFYRPLFVNCNLEIDGASRYGTMLVQGGPAQAIVINPPGMTGVDVGPSLVGAGHSMRTDGGSYWIDLRASTHVEVDGKGASTDTTGFTGFTAEAFVKMTSALPGYAGVVQSAGCVGTPGGTLPGCTAAFELGAMDGNAYGTLTLAGQSYALEGPAISLNAVHHLALAYDGVQTIRLYLDGAVAQAKTTSTANASLSQHEGEDVSVGPETAGFYGATRHPAILGYIDSVRLSQRDEYPAPFAVPTTKLALEPSATLVLLNFATNASGTTTGDDNWYYPVVRTAEPDGSPEKTVSVTMKNFGFVYRGVFAVNAVNSKFRNMYSGIDEGFLLTGQSAGLLVDDVTTYNARFGLLAVNATGAVINDFTVAYGRMAVVINGGSNVQITNLVQDPLSSASEYGLYFLRSDVRINSINLNSQANPTGPWKGFVVVDHPTAPFQVSKARISNGSTSPAQAPIIIDGGQGYRLEAVNVSGSQYFQQMIHVNSPIGSGAPHLAVGMHMDAAAAVLSDDPIIQVLATAGH
jgi:hypothetical protein